MNQIIIVYKTIQALFRSVIQSGQSYLIPLILVLLTLAIFLVFLQVVSPLAPFVYSLF